MGKNRVYTVWKTIRLCFFWSYFTWLNANPKEWYKLAGQYTLPDIPWKKGGCFYFSYPGNGVGAYEANGGPWDPNRGEAGKFGYIVSPVS